MESLNKISGINNNKKALKSKKETKKTLIHINMLK